MEEREKNESGWSIAVETRNNVNRTSTIEGEDHLFLAPFEQYWSRSKKRRRLIPPNKKSDITFEDFRMATIEKYSNFSFLGPASMAVYWLKVYLKMEPFGWIHYENPPSNDCRKRSYFCHIPGQYLKDRGERHVDFLSQEVILQGTQGIHYASSYVSVYNMLRKYGKFGRNDNGEIVLLNYKGPSLHKGS